MNPQEFSSPQACWNFTYGFVNPGGPSGGAPQGSLAWWINYTVGKGWSVIFPEWGDDGPSPYLCFTNMAKLINNPANKIMSHNYWSMAGWGNNSADILLNGAKQTAFINAFGPAAVGSTYGGTFFPNWAAVTAVQLSSVASAVPGY